jgi:hypothetical protein
MATLEGPDPRPLHKTFGHLGMPLAFAFVRVLGCIPIVGGIPSGIAEGIRAYQERSDCTSTVTAGRVFRALTVPVAGPLWVMADVIYDVVFAIRTLRKQQSLSTLARETASPLIKTPPLSAATPPPSEPEALHAPTAPSPHAGCEAKEPESATSTDLRDETKEMLCLRTFCDHVSRATTGITEEQLAAVDSVINSLEKAPDTLLYGELLQFFRQTLRYRPSLLVYDTPEDHNCTDYLRRFKALKCPVECTAMRLELDTWDLLATIQVLRTFTHSNEPLPKTFVQVVRETSDRVLETKDESLLDEFNKFFREMNSRRIPDVEERQTFENLKSAFLKPSSDT